MFRRSEQMARILSSCWLVRILQHQLLLGFPFQEDRVPSMIVQFRISFGSLEELGCIWDLFGMQPIELDIFIQYIVEGQRPLGQLMAQNSNNCWLEHIWQHQLLLGFPQLQGMFSNSFRQFRIFFDSLGELGCIWDLFGMQPIELDIFIQYIVEDQRPQGQLMVQILSSCWLVRILQHQLLLGFPFQEDRVPSMIVQFRISFGSLEELGCIWDLFGMQPIELDIFIQYIVEGQRPLGQLMAQNSNNCWLEHIWQHQLLLGFPQLQGMFSNSFRQFRIFFDSLGELGCIWDLFGMQPIELDIFIQYIVEDQRPQGQLMVQILSSCWLVRILQHQLLLGFPFQEDRVPSMIVQFRISFGSLEELGCIWDLFGMQPIELDIFIQYIVEGQRPLGQLMAQNSNNCWLEHIWQHQLLLGFPQLQGMFSNSFRQFRIFFDSLGELGCIWDLFGMQPIELDIFIQYIVEDQRPQGQLMVQILSSCWLVRILQHQLLLGFPFQEDRVPSMIVQFRISFGSLEELGCIWDLFGMQPIELDIFIQYIVEGQQALQHFKLMFNFQL